MNIKEIIERIKFEDKLFGFSISIINDEYIFLSGLKNILLSTSSEIKLSFYSKKVEVTGVDLTIIELGGGEIYIKGQIIGVQFV